MFAHKSFRIQNSLSTGENLAGLFSDYSGNALNKYWGNIRRYQADDFENQQEELVLLLNQVVSDPEASDVL
jgi:hypothetical protein